MLLILLAGLLYHVTRAAADKDHSASHIKDD